MPKKSSLGITVKQREDRLEYQRQWRRLNPDYEKTRRNHEKVRESAWRRRYGITRQDYDRMLSDQEGRCAICKTGRVGRNHTHFHVDHCHETGLVRGLLCDLCNRGLGYFKDSPKTLSAAADYLRTRQTEKLQQSDLSKCQTHPTPDIDWKDLALFEQEDTTTGSQELACSGGVCDIVDISK